jgi:hypothetical protein
MLVKRTMTQLQREIIMTNRIRDRARTEGNDWLTLSASEAILELERRLERTVKDHQTKLIELFDLH